MRMNPLKNRPRLPVTLLVLVIVVLMVQNFFLVTKTSEQRETIDQLNQQIDHFTQVKAGDSISSFIALNLDSSLAFIEPGMDSKRVLLLVFTTWCNACEQNMGQWNLLVNELSQQDVHILGLSPDSLYKIRDYSRRVSVSFPVYSVVNDFSVMKKHKLLSFPKTLLIDNMGVVLRVWSGILDDEKRQDITTAVKRRL